MFIIFVGDTSPEVAIAAKKFSKDAFLIDSSNYQSILNSETDINNIVAYTSQGDLISVTVLWEILCQADEIYYTPPISWSDEKKYYYDNIYADPHELVSMQITLEFMLLKLHKEKSNVQNFDISIFSNYYTGYTNLQDTRKSSSRQLWSVGCSITYGVGVSDEERYGYLIGKELNYNVSYLAIGGSGTEWQADQILRSDIKKDDIVVWGLSSAERFSFWDTDLNKVEHITPGKIRKGKCKAAKKIYNTKHLNLMLLDPTRLYQTTVHLRQVINFCNKIGAKLLIIGLIPPYHLDYLLADCKEYVQYRHQNNPYPVYDFGLVDLGTDNEHPGPKQHIEYAKFAIKHLKRLNYV